ncbi:hypothetical protein MKW98_002332, partial [Papaver atlanticum]
MEEDFLRDCMMIYIKQFIAGDMDNDSIIDDLLVMQLPVDLQDQELLIGLVKKEEVQVQIVIQQGQAK